MRTPHSYAHTHTHTHSLTYSAALRSALLVLEDELMRAHQLAGSTALVALMVGNIKQNVMNKK